MTAAFTTTTAWRSRIVGHDEVAPDQLLANPKNWRIHPKAQQEALAGVIDRVGVVQEVMVNQRTGHLVDGHLRVELALSRGEPAIPVSYVDLSEEEEAIVLASLDPLAAMAATDPAKLEELLGEVALDNAALEEHLATLLPAKARAGQTDPDDVPEPPAESYVQRGEVWLLGDHRIMCGDSTKAEDVARLMDGVRAALCFTSPPYAQQRVYGGSGFDWDVLMDGVVAQLPDVMEGGASALVNLGLVHRDGLVDQYWAGWLDRSAAAGWPLYGWYVWDQGWGLPGDWAGRLAPSFEFVFHLASKARHTNKTAATVSAGKVRNSTFRRKDGSLREFTGNGEQTGSSKVPDAVIRVNRQIGPVQGGDHPAVFSVGLPQYCIPVWTGAGDAVYEPFSGSGTTIIAAETLGRRCYAMELEPRYVQVAIERWQAFTGQEARRA